MFGRHPHPSCLLLFQWVYSPLFSCICTVRCANVFWSSSMCSSRISQYYFLHKWFASSKFQHGFAASCSCWKGRLSEAIKHSQQSQRGVFLHLLNTRERQNYSLQWRNYDLCLLHDWFLPEWKYLFFFLSLDALGSKHNCNLDNKLCSNRIT